MAEDEPPAGAGATLEIHAAGKAYRDGRRYKWAVRNVTLDVKSGQTLALVGESGSGKTTLGRLAVGLTVPTEGKILVEGKQPGGRSGSARAQMVFQDPRGSLNRHLSVGASVAEPIRHMKRDERRSLVAELVERVGLDPRRVREHPSSFSGGQLQRLVIARALVSGPKLLVCDEPTSALDVSVQAQIINLLLSLQQELGYACLFITHDLGVARAVADEVAVLLQGELVARCAAGRFFGESPLEGYPQQLLAAARRQSLDRGQPRKHGEVRLQY